MYSNALKLFLFSILLAVTQSSISRDRKQLINAIEDVEDVFEENFYEEVDIPEDNDDSKRPTNVIIKENYFDCININSDVDKLSTNFSVVSNESCFTLYRFAAFEIEYDVTFKNGSLGRMKILLELQDSERTIDTIIVTLTGKVAEGYLTGAHFQSIIVYPVINDINKCLTEPGITELQSNSASVTFILLPSSPVPDQPTIAQADSARKLPEAFDCFGSATIDYIPGLVNFKLLGSQ